MVSGFQQRRTGRLFGWTAPSDRVAEKALADALRGEMQSWTSFLGTHPHRDGISAIHSTNAAELLRVISDPETRRPSPSWLTRLYDGINPRGELNDPAILLRHDAGMGLQNLLCRLLEQHARDIPESGFLLYVTEYLEWCLVFRYQLSGAAAKVRFLHGIETPNAIYNVYELINTASEETRSVMRNVLKSRAKLVGHRGVLTHVDRFSEASVFGPSIDTLYLHEVLALLIYEVAPTESAGPVKIRSALEIGSGNGFLSTALLTHAKSLDHLIFADIDLKAIVCTLRNLDRANTPAQIRRHGMYGEFVTSLLGNKFDLVIANPPYVPLAPKVGSQLGGQHGVAVGGTKLLEHLLNNGLDLLNENGALVMIYSDLAELEVASALRGASADIYPLYPGKGFRALFDVEDVFEDPQWVDFLRKHRGLERAQDIDAYHHNIRVIAMTQPLKERTGRDVNTIAGRVQKLSNILSSVRGSDVV